MDSGILPIVTSFIGSALVVAVKGAGGLIKRGLAPGPEGGALTEQVATKVEAALAEVPRNLKGHVIKSLDELARQHPLTPEFLSDHDYNIDAICNALPEPKNRR